MSTTVLLVRHCDNDYSRNTVMGWMPGVHLNEKGRAQAEALAERLAGVQAIYSSPLERARETAAPLARRLGLEVRICEALAEVRTGDWTTRTFREMENDPEWLHFNRHRSTARIPGGETMLEVQARMVSALEQMRCAHPDSVVVAVSHGDPIRAALLHYLGAPLDFIPRMELHMGSVSTVAFHEWGPVVVRFNAP
ncbi:MAG: histidine phosphatase family protein [Acidobacteriota bacterium]